MHADHEVFLQAIAGKRQVTVTFFHVKDQCERTLTCAPLDFGPLRGAKEAREHYQLWDLGARRPPYNVTIAPEDIRTLTVLDATFEPEEFIKWAFKRNAWAIVRDWGAFS
jgi:hypothetical protein